MTARPAAPVAPATPGEAASWPADAVEVGRIAGAWGVKGALKVQAFSAAPEALFSSKRWYIAPPATPSPTVTATAGPRLMRVTNAREHGDFVVASIDGLGDRDAAQALTGWRIAVARSSFPTPDSDEFYWVDLIGCSVVNRDGAELGRVVSLLETGPHCVLQLDGLDAEKQPRLIPFVAAYVDTVDVGAKRIQVDWPLDY